MAKSTADDFWRHKTFADMSRDEWERLCDGCGRCCLQKLIDDETDEMVFTSIACKELDLNNARCKHYLDRAKRVPDCLVLHPGMHDEIFEWLPDTCAYRLLWQGKDLPDWHPLVAGTRAAMRNNGISVIHFAISETLIGHDDPEDYVIVLPDPDI